MNVEHEIKLLIDEIKRLGAENSENKTWTVKYGVLFSDDKCANIFEALVGTLRAAKKRKIVKFDGEILLQGVHDQVDVVLLKDTLWLDEAETDTRSHLCGNEFCQNYYIDTISSIICK